MTVKSSDVSVVLQGPVRFETPESVESVRRLLPEAELILSTWEDEDVSSLGSIRVLRSEKPSAPIQHDRRSVPNNLNRLIRSTKKGVAAVTRPYVLKMRSDMVLDSLAFLDSFERFPERGPMPLFAHKVLVPALFLVRPIEATQCLFTCRIGLFSGWRRTSERFFRTSGSCRA